MKLKFQYFIYIFKLGLMLCLDMCRVNTYFHELHLGWYFVVADYVEITKKKKKKIHCRACRQSYDTQNEKFFQMVSPIHYSYCS